MHTQPNGWPLAQHLVLEPQKSVQTPALQVKQRGHSASSWQDGGHDSAATQT
jgi:hypothetical protein